MKEDPGIAWVREVRHKISAEHGHDSRRLCEHYMKLQERHKDRLLTKQATPEKKKVAVG